MRPAILRTLLTFLAACAAAAAPALAAPAPGEICPAIDPPAAIGPGVRAFVDPATGKLRPPTAEERSRLAAAAGDRSARVYEVVVSAPTARGSSSSTTRSR